MKRYAILFFNQLGVEIDSTNIETTSKRLAYKWANEYRINNLPDEICTTKLFQTN